MSSIHQDCAQECPTCTYTHTHIGKHARKMWPGMPYMYIHIYTYWVFHIHIQGNTLYTYQECPICAYTHTHIGKHARQMWPGMPYIYIHAYAYWEAYTKNVPRHVLYVHTYVHILGIPYTHIREYGVATISRLLKIKGLFCRIPSLLQGSFAKETYNFKEPTNRSHPIPYTHIRYCWVQLYIHTLGNLFVYSYIRICILYIVYIYFDVLYTFFPIYVYCI